MTIKPDLSQPIPDDFGTVHFIGIGGSGMSGIARMFLAAGHRVTGSDSRESATTGRMRELGADVRIGHDAANVGDADTVVVTSALWPDNPELLEARRRGLPVMHRSQALAALIAGRRLVAVAGAHGKTTSTGMIVTALVELGLDPNFVNGGVIQSLGVSSGSGASDTFVVEADESDGSFLLYDTAIALVTNVDADHLDHYGSEDAFIDAFVTFASRASERVVISSDDAGARRVTAGVRATAHAPSIVTFGEADDADVRVTDVVETAGVQAVVHVAGVAHPLALRVPGRHNAINAAGAVTVLVGLGVDAADAVRGVEAFGGTERRFELHGTERGVRVYDDYAHHPTEVAVALRAARSVVGEGRVIAIHQPHLYSRTRLMAGDFARVYEELADHTVVLDVYGAREDPEPGVTGALVQERFTDQSRVDYLPDWSEAAARAADLAEDGDIVMTLSCGDVYRIIPQVLADLHGGRVAAEAPAR
ncbi:UDP-N-acetylmuramate--L-alanine ligase [Curtobacterium sp. MCBD17_034]|uniref:UDP-N-acetylmuramate--L-alanine ligase n=1 Tax=unclassified Curtobacterium TaxID=257496 RepID=UPI000DAA5312|nr:MULTISPECIES: UDP-N-acetylmuramate--L-alanine ligase [unclassified Curtobacterium]PZF61040.1 UDP-N-acetylmuramate--L-alanine ligase [Curtobacterium sp. MCBD17_034]PZM40390.1 UDP-N-acetylmuramate--L-alanine ligase [Curtobacterium sp. MCBD17_031]